ARVRGRRDDHGAGEETWRAPESGAPSARQRDPTGQAEVRSRCAQTGSGQKAHRPDAGGRPASAAQATAHGTSDLDTAARGAFRAPHRGAHGPAIRADEETGAGTQLPGSIRAAELRLGPRSTGRLVR